MTFKKSWDELTKEEQWNYTEQLFEERQKKGLDPLAKALLEPKDQWYCEHMKAAMEENITENKKKAKIKALTLKVDQVAAKKEAINADLEAAKARLAALKARVVK